MALFVITKSKSLDERPQVIGQTTDEEKAHDIAMQHNDNRPFVKKKDGTIAGANSTIEIFTKDELTAGLGETIDLDNQD